ncbi:MAG: ABC transporter ATP-binding protein [Micavibrio aeruginosavorus]|nr:ABC transporter ATP-binding protein [Micavibrio aeruginosavorus]
MSAATPLLLEAEHLTRTLEGDIPVTLVRDASVTVGIGEFVSVTGPSGSGKSSLLYLLGLLDTPTSGIVKIEGVDATALDENSCAALRLEKLGFVFQSHFLLPEFTALENVMLPMRHLGQYPDKIIQEKAFALLDDLGLGDHARKHPKQLSGGQSQRVAIARALANDPLLILADEPTGNLDSASSALVQGILKDLAHGHDRAVIAVTHDPAFAAQADRRIHIIDGAIVTPPEGVSPDGNEA